MCFEIRFGVIMQTLKRAFLTAILCVISLNGRAGPIVVGHDVNTFGSLVAGTQEAMFAVNVATFLTAGDATKNILLYESNPGDGTRNFAPNVISALNAAGFSVTVASSYATPFAAFDAIFVAQDFPTVGFLDNSELTSYVVNGGGVYLAGGVGPSPAAEAAGWNTFLGNFGLGFVGSTYNGINSVSVTGAHPIFAGITSLRSGNGQSISNLGTNPLAQTVQSAGGQGVYAVVNVPATNVVPEPSTYALLASALAMLALVRRRTA